MANVVVIVLGLIALVLLVSIVMYSIHRRAVYVANLIFSLALFMARSCVIYSLAPTSNTATRENSQVIELIRGSLVYLLGWVVISAILVIVMNILVPMIHQNFAIQRTPPGEPDKVVSIHHNARRSA